MRYLIDTNIFVYLATDVDSLNRDVLSLLEEPDALLYMSAESVRELIVAYQQRLVLQAVEINRRDGSRH